MKYLLSVAVLAAFSLPAFAQTIIPTTPDISIGNTSTVDVVIPGGRANYVAVKNDCTDVVYFDLGGALGNKTSSTQDERDFGLRLGSGESFSGSFKLAGSFEASASSGASGSCTFTVVLGR